MRKFDLTAEDRELVAEAIAAVKQPISQIGRAVAPAYVGSALRLEDGSVITSQNLIADVGSISMCAEPQAIAQANRHPDKKITAIVAVYYHKGQEPKIIPPCGRCREIITDFAPDGFVILRDPGTDKMWKTPVNDLLPLKYAEYWDGDTLI